MSSGDPASPAGSQGLPDAATPSGVMSETGADGPSGIVGEDDLKTFAFATSDEAELAEQAGGLAEIVATIQRDATARDLDAVEDDARALLAAAEDLERAAADAEGRQRDLEPQDADLREIRTNALDAFGLTADYAGAAADLAQAALDLDLPQLLAVAQDAADLVGTSEELTTAYADLNAELVAWAETHPADAAKALARYA
jgi:hypothetical protein